MNTKQKELAALINNNPFTEDQIKRIGDLLHNNFKGRIELTDELFSAGGAITELKESIENLVLRLPGDSSEAVVLREIISSGIRSVNKVIVLMDETQLEGAIKRCEAGLVSDDVNEDKKLALRYAIDKLQQKLSERKDLIASGVIVPQSLALSRADDSVPSAVGEIAIPPSLLSFTTTMQLAAGSIPSQEEIANRSVTRKLAYMPDTLLPEAQGNYYQRQFINVVNDIAQKRPVVISMSGFQRSWPNISKIMEEVSVTNLPEFTSSVKKLAELVSTKLFSLSNKEIDSDPKELSLLSDLVKNGNKTTLNRIFCSSEIPLSLLQRIQFLCVQSRNFAHDPATVAEIENVQGYLKSIVGEKSRFEKKKAEREAAYSSLFDDEEDGLPGRLESAVPELGNRLLMRAGGRSDSRKRGGSIVGAAFFDGEINLRPQKAPGITAAEAISRRAIGSRMLFADDEDMMPEPTYKGGSGAPDGKVFADEDDIMPDEVPSLIPRREPTRVAVAAPAPAPAVASSDVPGRVVRPSDKTPIDNATKHSKI